MLIALTLAVVLIPVLALAAVALLHGHEGAALEASMRGFAGETPAERARATHEPLAA